MTTAFQTGPGFYAALTSDHCPSLPPNTMRVYCARLEAYDIPTNDPDDSGLETRFQLLFHDADGKPEIARAILQLADSIEGNKESLLKELNA